MHAGPDNFDKQSKKWKKIERKTRKERRPLPTILYNFTLSPYFVRKESGIPISSPDAKAFVIMVIDMIEKLLHLEHWAAFCHHSFVIEISFRHCYNHITCVP